MQRKNSGAEGVCVAAPRAAAPTDHFAGDDIPSADAAAAQEKRLKSKAWEMRFRIGISRRYCNRLASHYGGLDNFTTVVSLIGGSTAFAEAFGGQTGLGLYASLAVVGASAARLAFRWPDKGRHFADLYQRYTRLQERLVRAADLTSDATMREIEADFVVIEAAEPATRNALMIVCHNEEVIAQGADPGSRHRLRWWQRWFAIFATLPPRSWE